MPLWDAFAEIKKGWRRGFYSEPWLTDTSMKGKTLRNAEEKELAETRALFDEVKATFDASVYADPDDANAFMIDVAIEVFKRSGRDFARPIAAAIVDTTQALLTDDGALYGFPEIDWSRDYGIDVWVALRTYLNRKKRFLSDHEYQRDVWSEKAIRIFEGMLAYLPDSAFIEAPDDEHEHRQTLTTPLLDFFDEPEEVIERLVVTLFDDDIVSLGLFEDIRIVAETNLLLVSGIEPHERHTTKRPIVFPTQQRGKTAADLVEMYLRNTPFEAFFNREMVFSIPFPVRFEHCHIVGGTGHGKTQLLQTLILDDLEAARVGDRSVVVIDSQGDLIRTVSHLAHFSPNAEKSLADRFMLIDPNDVEHPVSLNMFDVNVERINSYSPLERERVLNGIVELYEYIFGALLGAELTQKQGVIFRYLARLMLVIPNATVQTLRELMENGTKFKPYMEQLEGTSKKFFETQFFDKSFRSTKTQILRRLWGVLSNPTFERMFSNPVNKVDMFEAMNSGKIILINTAKDLLKQEGCEIFGRFFISLITQAALQRSVLKPEERTPTFVYIDEASDYLDEHVGSILNQARKYRVGLVLAHQNLGQVSSALEQTIMASTSIKLAGGVSARDARAFAQEMQCSPDFVQGMKKRGGQTEFACWIKNVIPQAIPLRVPLGTMESLPSIDEADYQALIERNRERYAATEEERAAEVPMETPSHEFPMVVTPEDLEQEVEPVIEEEPPAREPEPIAETEPPALEPEPMAEAITRAVKKTRPFKRDTLPLGKGGYQHKYLQNLLKEAAQDRGLRTVVEKSIEGGSGSVDVAVEIGDKAIACEISVSSTVDQEMGNIRKCLDAGYDKVIVVSDKARHLRNIEKAATGIFDAEECERMLFLEPVGVLNSLDEWMAETQTREETVRGYRVKVKHSRVEQEDAERRRKAIAETITRTMTKLKGL